MAQLLADVDGGASGFLVGNTVAAVLAVWFVHSQLAERAFYPIAVFVNTIPIIAVAPILVLLLGNGYAPKIGHRAASSASSRPWSTWCAG